MNGQDPNNQVNNELNGSVLGTTTTGAVGPTPTPNVVPNINPVMPETLASPAPVAPATPQPQVNPTFVNNPTVAPVMSDASVNQTPVAPATPVSPQAASAEPVAVPIPGTEGTPGINNLTGNTIGSGMPNVGQDQVNSNSFVEPQKMQNIGVVPPPVPENNKKKPINKALFLILIVVLIAAVAFGVYYFLSISNKKVKLTAKNITVGVGEVLSDKITDYASVSKGNIANCSLNLRNVNSLAIGEYEYSITCGEDVYKGKVTVADKTAPVAKLKKVFAAVNGQITVDDFVESCEDESECTKSFENEETVKNYLNTAGGPYKVDIKVEDKAGNSAVVQAELYVTNYAVSLYTSFTSQSEAVSGYQATKNTIDVFPIGQIESGGYEILNVARRDVKYTFTSEEEYKTITSAKEDTLTFDGITGEAIYDDENLTFVISNNLPMDTLNSENGGSFPTQYTDVYNIYVTNKGYTVANKQSYNGSIQ